MAPRGRRGAESVDCFEEDDGYPALKDSAEKKKEKQSKKPKKVQMEDDIPLSTAPQQIEIDEPRHRGDVDMSESPRAGADNKEEQAPAVGSGPPAAALPKESSVDMSASMAIPESSAPADQVSSDTHLNRRIMSSAAAIGGAAGMLLSGPVSGVALGAAAAYATTREDHAGALARKAGSAYLHAQDRAIDEGLRAADRTVDAGLQRLSDGIEASLDKVPAPLRKGLKAAGLADRPAPRMDPARKEEAGRMRKKYPDRVPIIVERSPYSDLPRIDKTKFLVPGSMLCGEFKYIVHKHVNAALAGGVRAEQTIYLFVNGVSPKTSTPMRELYDQCKHEDGFLYVRYGAENTLG
eukprot:gnl/TRDRNA2_/TRDRNA2_50325_c0_seq1.p1 gnl/TRDRNA2_/TRDRNA2_50325_c0~~gnl/TRDRNA2_/TRDRNA2_50325_c0_seq1.p1  ORF type:complete len:351 (+),score=64.40 gnl/TRDRNA2_/TRDRNA2_50325_c0_seq1:87-1139(+)